MPWPGIKAAALRALIYLLGAAAFAGPPLARAEGNVGCLFSERLCLDDEWCYDDYAFGRCVSTASTLDEDDLYRYDLERDELHEISRELSRLFALGYRWSHGYTQCRLQAMLYATKNGLSFEDDACSHLSDQDLEAALRVMEGQVPLDPQEVAVVRFTPSIDDPQGLYADEVYYPPPPDPDQQLLRERILGSNGEDILDMEDPYAAYQLRKRAWIPVMRRRSAPIEYFDNQFTSPSIYVPDDSTQLEFLPKMLPYNSVTARDTQAQTDNYDDDEDGVKEMYQIIRLLNRLNLSPEDLKTVLSPVSYSKLVRILQEFERREEEAIEKEEMERLLLGDNRNGNDVEYNGRDDYDAVSSDFKRLFDRGELSGDEMPESRIYYDENDNADEVQEYGSGFRSPPSEIFRELANSERYGSNGIGSRGVGLGEDAEVFRELQQQEMEERERFSRYNDNKIKHKYNSHPNIYTEGGVVYDASDNSEDEDNEGHSADQLEELGNFLDKYNWGFKRPERLDVKKPGPPFDQQINEAIKAGKIHDVNDDTPYPSMMKKVGGVHPNLQHGSDSEYSYVYVNFKQNLRSWTHTQSIMSNISALLHVEPNAFVQGRTDRNAVTFKVLPNSRGLNATEVARKIDASKDQLGAQTGMEIESAGIGNKYGMQSVMSVPLQSTIPGEFYTVLLTVCGVLGAMVVAAGVLMLIRRHLRSRDKLQNLARPDTEASKDYQDLCRARMATKSQGDTGHGRVTSLSRESEQSPSSRSSTSSWSEEPALHNMDISTGHMVLSYMEDHLKNKDRLEQEWTALCAYLAEPCDTTVARLPANENKNRTMKVLPYDHSRVVLNSLSNAAGGDFINASSITDHDPRNPAYIAAQGPLLETVPEFWQMVWEQGAVVIVMLTRLTEGGTGMCHRYWPEEGSELYHIYEVHLVSEHIWCDDYLVRSFYLKNVRTGETRTVTQFHFLSWPESGIPASTKALLEFRRKVNKSYRGRSCPIVVHCSDGAGRTGTYCLIDMVLSRMAKGAKEIDIAATLEHLRDQRMRMVASKQQFEFVLTAVAEEVHAILKALPPQPAPAQQNEKDKQ